MNIKNNIFIITKLSLLNIKKVLFSIYGAILLTIPAIVSIVYVSIIPIDHAVTAIFTSSLAASTIFVFGATFFEYEKSSLKSSSKNIIKKYMYFFAIFVSIVVISYFIIFEVFFIIQILDYFDPFDSIMKKVIQENLFYTFSYDFFSINFPLFFYYITMTILLNILLSYFIQFFTRSLKNYMLVSVAYFLVVMIFADSLLTDYSLIPIGNFIDKNTYEIDSRYSFIVDNTLYINPVSTKYNSILGNGNGGYEDSTFEIGNYLWWIKLFIPQTYLNKLFFLSFSNPQLSSKLIYMYNGTSYNVASGLNLQINYFSNLTLQQIFVFAIPIFWISILSIIVFISSYKSE